MVDPSDEGSATEGEAGFVATKLGWSEAGAEVEAPGWATDAEKGLENGLAATKLGKLKADWVEGELEVVGITNARLWTAEAEGWLEA